MTIIIIKKIIILTAVSGDNPGRGVGGGVAIHIRKDIKFNQLDTSEFDEEFLAISFESDKRKIALATMYNPPGTSPKVENFKFILNKYPDSIFMGDYNSTHYTNTSSDILDLCIVSRSIATEVDTCRVGLDVGSDHMPVHLVINSSKIVRQNK